MRLRWLAVGFFVLVGLMVFPQMALAAEPAPSSDAGAPGQSQGLLGIMLDIEFDENGEWVADASIESPGMEPIPGMPNFIAGNLRLENQSYMSLTTLFGLFGMEMDLPKAAPSQVQRAVEAGLQSIAMKKTFLDDGVQEVRLYANDRLLIAAEASVPLLSEALASVGMEGMEEWLLPLVTQSETTLVLRFPAEQTVEVTFEDDFEPSEGPHANMISLGATVAESDGLVNVVSVAGFSVEEVQGIAGGVGAELALPSIATTMLSDFDIEELSITAGQDGLEVDAGEGRWMKLLWDAESRASAIELLPAVGQFLYWDFQDIPMYLAQAEPWIAHTGIELKLFVSDTPNEALPMLSIGDRIDVQVGAGGGLMVEGYDLGSLMGVAVDLDALGPYVGALPIGAAWDGDAMSLRLAIDGAQMPYVAVNPDTLPGVANLFLADSIPMDKVTAILRDADLELGVGLESEGADETSLDYEAGAAAPVGVYVVPRVVIDQLGDIGVGDPPLKVSSIVEGFGLDLGQVKDLAGLYASGYGDDLDVIGLTVGPDAIKVAVDRETALELRWDDALRKNLLGFVENYYPIPDVPFISSILPDWQDRAIEAVAGTGWGMWGLEVAFEDEEIPASGLERTLQALGLIR